MRKDTKKCAPKLIAEERRAMLEAETEAEAKKHLDCACQLQLENYSDCLWKDCRYCKNQKLFEAVLKKIAEGVTININGGNVTINVK